MSETPGAPTDTAPSDTGDFVRQVGWGIATDTIYFNPAVYHIEVA